MKNHFCLPFTPLKDIAWGVFFIQDIYNKTKVVVVLCPLQGTLASSDECNVQICIKEVASCL